jgi:hypothetical protein
VSSKPPSPPDAKQRAFELIEDLVDEEDFEASGKASPEALRAELAELGIDPERLRAKVDRVLAEAGTSPAAGAGAGASAGSGKVIPIARATKRRVWPVMALVAAAAVVVLVLAGGGGRAIVAYFSPEPEPSSTQRPKTLPQGPPQTPEQYAAGLRKQGLDSCQRGYYEDCAQKLDEAQKIDPAGENAPEVQLARQEIADYEHPPDASAPMDAGLVKPPFGRAPKAPPRKP